MTVTTGRLLQDGVTGQAWGDCALHTDSPLRAFEGELGGQAPLGLRDPLGLGEMPTLRPSIAAALRS